MNASGCSESRTWEVPVLLRGESDALSRWLTEPGSKRDVWCAGLIVVGAGVYGAAIGCWRDPMQAVYTAIKFPGILLCTALGNGLLNAMLAPLLGLNLSFRASLRAVLLSFAILAIVLGAFSPLVLFFIWNVPSFASASAPNQAAAAFTLIKLSQVVLIAFAGVAANVRLARLLTRIAGEVAVGRRVLFAWLAGNLLLGAQLTWILRPFFGSPHLEVQFLRPNAFEGNFYETVFDALRHLFNF